MIKDSFILHILHFAFVYWGFRAFILHLILHLMPFILHRNASFILFF